MFKQLPWDSKFFGYSIATLHLVPSDTTDFIAEFKKSDVTCLYLYIDKSAKVQNERCERHGYSPVEIRLRFAKHPRIQINENKKSNIEITTDVDRNILKKLYPLAHQISHVSRFFKDVRFRPLAEKLYEQWIQLSADNNTQKMSFLAWKGTIPVGIVTLKSHGNSIIIDLFGVKKSYRRKGIGAMLLRAAENWAYQTGAQSLEVVTQKDNIASCSLYKKHGFTQQSETMIYHLWKRDR